MTDDVVRAEIRKAAVLRQPAVGRREMPGFGQVTKAEKGLIWWLIHEPGPTLEALATVEAEDLEGLAAREVLDLARKLGEDSCFSPSVLLERLNTVNAQLVTAIAATSLPPAPALDCAHAIRRLRWERERADIQREIDRLQ